MADRVVMVTGAGGNVGSAVARRFAADGAKLVLVGRKAEELQALVDELGGMPGVADVTDPASVDALVKQVESSYGRIDVLAHTVGGFANSRMLCFSNGGRRQHCRCPEIQLESMR